MIRRQLKTDIGRWPNLPLRSWTTRPTTRVPKPWRLGGLAGGPPVSHQRITSCVAPRDHSIRREPEVNALSMSAFDPKRK